jgi:hypothetical protein
MTDKSKWRTDQGVYYTKSLFFEMITSSDKPNCVYTLKAEDHQLGYPSLRRLYLEEEDPTEYNFANKYLGGIDHWKKLVECEWFKPHLDAWRDELELKLKAKAYKRLMAEAADPLSKHSIEANKFILSTVRRVQKNEDLGEKNSKGRPDKSSVDKKALQIAQEQFELDQDANRILGATVN